MGKDLKGKELGKGLTQRKDGVYLARFYNRFGIRQCLYSSSLAELKKKLDQCVFDDRALHNVKENKLTLTKWYKNWLECYKSGVVRPSTLRIYANSYDKHIKPILGNAKIKDITTMDIRMLLNKLAKKGFSFEVRNKARILLQDMFDKALIDEYVLRNPVRGVKLVRDEKKDVRVLSRLEQELFFNCALGTYCYNMFAMQILTGLRPGELFALTVEDVDTEQMLVNVDKTLSYDKFEGESKKDFHLGPPKTDNSYRKVPINDNFLVYYENQLKLSDVIKTKFPDGRWKKFGNLLFITRRGSPFMVQSYNDAITRIVNEINAQLLAIEQIEKFSGHTFRHTFATRCLESDVQPKVLQKYLGHATLQMTMDLYVHVSEEYSKDEMGKVEINLGTDSGDID